jgi:hypothetical protein
VIQPCIRGKRWINEAFPPDLVLLIATPDFQLKLTYIYTHISYSGRKAADM